MMFPQACITQKSSIGGVFPFLICHLLTSLHWSLVSTFVLCSFLLNHTFRLSSCKILFFLGCIFKFPTWWDLPLFLFFFFFSLALTFSQTALLGFQPSKLLFFSFFIFFFPFFFFFFFCFCFVCMSFISSLNELLGTFFPPCISQLNDFQSF